MRNKCYEALRDCNKEEYKRWMSSLRKQDRETRFENLILALRIKCLSSRYKNIFADVSIKPFSLRDG